MLRTRLILGVLGGLTIAGCERPADDPAAGGDPAPPLPSKRPAPAAKPPAPPAPEASVVAAPTEPEPAPAVVPTFAADNPSIPDLRPAVDTALFVRADGIGSPVRGADLRDPHAVAERLAWTAKARGDTWRIVDGATAVLSLDLSGKASAAVTVTSTRVATPAGVAVGQTYDALRAAVPTAVCELGGGADGQLVYCTFDNGVSAVFVSEYDGFWDLPSPTTEADIRKAIGRAKVVRLELWAGELPEPANAPVSWETGVLAAGVYNDPYVAAICELDAAPQRCERPRAAVIAGVVPADAAVTRAKTIAREGLAIGYPLVVHSDELGLADRERIGVAVVLGLFASEPAAKAWRDAERADAEIVVLGEADGGEHRVVARLREGAAVSAYPTAAAATAGSGTARCTLEGGELAVLAERAAAEHVYEAVPLTCPDGSAAFVAWGDTLLGTLAGARADAPAARWQVIGAECDQPHYARTELDDAGHSRGRPTPLPAPGC